MKEFKDSIKRFEKLLYLLDNKRIPSEQFKQVKYRPTINPGFNIRPTKEFIESFDWFICVPLIPGNTYGPFYRVDDKDKLEINDSDGVNPKSERGYFYGLEKPANKKEAKIMYHLKREENGMNYVHTFTIEPEDIREIFGAEIYIGPVVGGTGYQIQQNKITAFIIKRMVENGRITSVDPLND